jgi:hypothetical protein
VASRDRQADWQLLELFHNWLVSEEVGLDAGLAGIMCRNLAVFVDLFLEKLYHREHGVWVLLADVNREIVEDYLGYWFPMNVEGAALEELMVHLDGMRKLAEYLEKDWFQTTCSTTEDPDGQDDAVAKRFLARYERYRAIISEASAKKRHRRLEEWLVESW